MNPEFNRLLTSSAADRLDLFLATSARLGTTVQNVEKDFWVCWTLDALFNGLEPGLPRLLFKGGTSLSKGYGLIERFSEDIDITVFRDDIEAPASVEELEASSRKQRERRLEDIRKACQTFIAGTLRTQLDRLAARLPITGDQLRITPDEGDADGQSLLLQYPALSQRDPYIRPAVKIEAGAKSALDPHTQRTVRPVHHRRSAGFRSRHPQRHDRRSGTNVLGQGSDPAQPATQSSRIAACCAAAASASHATIPTWTGCCARTQAVAPPPTWRWPKTAFAMSACSSNALGRIQRCQAPSPSCPRPPCWI